jgi:hypothetical protein
MSNDTEEQTLTFVISSSSRKKGIIKIKSLAFSNSIRCSIDEDKFLTESRFTMVLSGETKKLKTFNKKFESLLKSFK